jgi:ATPase subunit of ABC transporter with duplicated ATPase domains
MDVLARELSRFEGIGIVVSHTMDFLDALCDSTVMLERSGQGSRAARIAARPIAALAEREQEQRFLREQKLSLASQVKKLDRAQKDAVREAEQTKKAKLSKSRLDPKDSSGRAKINLAVLSGRDRVGGKKAAALESALDRKRAAVDAVHVAGLRKTGAGLSGQRLERPLLYTAPAGAANIAGGALLLEHPALEIRNDSRIVLMGDNGCGKTSLVEHILPAVHVPARAVWYLRQELSARDRAEALDQFHALNNDERGAVLSVVYRLGSEPDAFLSTRALSPGEARKLLFGFALLRGASLIVLDEPTNHLDALAVNAFADAITEFEGAAVIVTHDRFFAEKTGRLFWHITRSGSGARLEITERGDSP